MYLRNLNTPKADYTHVTDPLVRGATHVHMPTLKGPLMYTGKGGVIPAAFDPTDPRTYRGPVYFT
jgi:hypothetical protein